MNLVFAHILELRVKALQFMIDEFPFGVGIFDNFHLAEQCYQEVGRFDCPCFKKSHADQHQGHGRMNGKADQYGYHQYFYFTHEKGKTQNQGHKAVNCQGDLVNNKFREQCRHCFAEGSPSFYQEIRLCRLTAGREGGYVIKILPDHGKAQRDPEPLGRMNGLDSHMKNERIQQPVDSHAADSNQQPAGMGVLNNECQVVHAIDFVQIYNQKYQGKST